MKGIIFAGGPGTKLYPLITVTLKQLFPVYDRPMIYYPLSVLMMAGIHNVLTISTPEDLLNLEHLLGNDSQCDVSFSYKVQLSPGGLAQVFVLNKELISDEPCTLVLDGNILYGNGLGGTLHKAAMVEHGATAFGYYVDDPERYGMVEFDENKKTIFIIEKPGHPASNYIATGLYFYNERVTKFVEQAKPSLHGGLEITDLNKMYLEDGTLNVQTLDRGYA